MAPAPALLALALAAALPAPALPAGFAARLQQRVQRGGAEFHGAVCSGKTVFYPFPLHALERR